MRTFTNALICCGCAALLVGAAHAQFRGGPNFTTTGADGQRSSWIRTDAKISVDRVGRGGFALAWKVKLPTEPSTAMTLDSYIGYRGFRSYVLMGHANNELTVIDSDLGRVEWTKKLPGAASRGSAGCAGGMTANVARATVVAFPAAAPVGRGGGGRGGAAKSTVSEAGAGSVIMQQQEAAREAAAAAAANQAAANQAGGRGRGANPLGGRGPGRNLEHINAISSDGMFHQGYLSNGEEPAAAVQFTPAGANVRDLTFVDGIAYAATSGGCAGAPNAVWAMDETTKQAIHWSPAAGDIAGGGFAFGPDAKVYVANTTGDLVALDPKKLEVQGAYRGGQPFSGSPVIFENKAGKTVIAAPTADGHIHLVAADGMTGAAFPAQAAGPLATYQAASGVRWIIAPTKDSIAAWKVSEQGDSLSAGWTAPLPAPLAPIIINGVVFAVSNSSTAVLHALDGSTGKDLWNSGKTMTAPVKLGGVSGAGTQVYVGTSDGTLYAFAFPIEH